MTGSESLPRLCGLLALLTLLGCAEGVERPEAGATLSHQAAASDSSSTLADNTESSSSDHSPSPLGTGDGSSQASESPPSEGSSPAIEFIPVNASELQEQIDRYRGQVVLVDFWALWCTNCLEEFPETVALHRELSPEGLVVLGLNFDSPQDIERREAAAAFLRRQAADFPQLICSVAGGGRAMDEFELEEGLPHYRIYGRDGELLESFNGKPENLRELLLELLQPQ